MENLKNKSVQLTEMLREMFRDTVLSYPETGGGYRYAILPEGIEKECFGIANKIQEWMVIVKVNCTLRNTCEELLKKVFSDRGSNTTLNLRKEPTVLWNGDYDEPKFIVYMYGSWSE